MIGLVLKNSGASLLDRIIGIRRKATDLAPLEPQVRQILWDANKARGLLGLDYTGKKYADLKPSTLKDRARAGYPPGPPLNRQGMQARVIQGCEIRVTIEPARLRILKSWPTVPWMEYHILGTPRMARRDPLGWGDELVKVRALLPAHMKIGR
jgi:hypothetical protein